jgi:hypothetical protein
VLASGIRRDCAGKLGADLVLTKSRNPKTDAATEIDADRININSADAVEA